MKADLFKIPRACNKVRAWAEYKPTGPETVETIIWITFLHDNAPLTPMGYIEGEAIAELKRLTDGWERVQPYPHNPLLQHVVDFIRPMGELEMETHYA